MQTSLDLLSGKNTSRLSMQREGESEGECKRAARQSVFLISYPRQPIRGIGALRVANRSRAGSISVVVDQRNDSCCCSGCQCVFKSQHLRHMHINTLMHTHNCCIECVYFKRRNPLENYTISYPTCMQHSE
jgi:hypothetical protein